MMSNTGYLQVSKCRVEYNVWARGGEITPQSRFMKSLQSPAAMTSFIPRGALIIMFVKVMTMMRFNLEP